MSLTDFPITLKSPRISLEQDSGSDTLQIPANGVLLDMRQLGDYR
jgi:hypothetical protein